MGQKISLVMSNCMDYLIIIFDESFLKQYGHVGNKI